MAKRIQTQANASDVTHFLEGVADEQRRDDAFAVKAMMERVTGEKATMWGSSIIGFGSKPYTNTTGTNDWFVVGFSPRKNATTIYGVHDGYGSPDPLLDDLGPHTTGKGCLYVKRLADVDQRVLERLICNAWKAAKA